MSILKERKSISYLCTQLQVRCTRLELLETVNWVAKENPSAAQDSEQAIALVHEWSDACGNPFGVRKRQLFKPEHIRKA